MPSARRAAAIKDETLAAPRRRCSSSWRRRSRRRAGSCTGRATQPRRTRSWSTLVQAEGADEVVKVKSLATDEIRLNEALEACGHPADRDRSGRADHPARRRAPVAPPRSRDPQEPDRDPRPVPRPARAARASPTSLPSSPRRPASICARHSCARGSRSRARTSPPPTPARSASSSRRATAACARRCPKC